MPLNYSKWDQLEISDGSDIEGHPNVDKKSFIRSISSLVRKSMWKQSDVHEKREARNHRIEQLGAEVACNDVLLARLRILRPKLAQSGSSYFSSEVDRLRTNPSPEAPPTNAAKPYDEMILTLLQNIGKRYKMPRPYVAPFPPYHHHSAGSSIKYCLDYLATSASSRALWSTTPTTLSPPHERITLNHRITRASNSHSPHLNTRTPSRQEDPIDNYYTTVTGRSPPPPPRSQNALWDSSTTQPRQLRVQRHLPPSPEDVEGLLQRYFQIINLWRPIHAAYDWPLALCDCNSIDQSRDLVWRRTP
ncbi:Cdc37 N terminal kinase binding-domain-containing protein [Lactarius akahatsu]|uniref:Cdc37 N terminal kinase binding-domain-containing protein n=1 Tax=Lactarius akahatsu TaxID=416441 RepID=A0AAD4Q921_9AGAM|nr:Cdc37 N terminal kinase binding-domain-containing protein [Lactarius akahatsu]